MKSTAVFSDIDVGTQRGDFDRSKKFEQLQFSITNNSLYSIDDIMVKKVTDKPLITDSDLCAIHQLSNTDIIVQGKDKDCYVLNEKLDRKQLFPIHSENITSIL